LRTLKPKWKRRFRRTSRVSCERILERRLPDKTATGLEKSFATGMFGLPIPGPPRLLQLRILRFGFLQDGDVRVGSFATAMVAASLTRKFRRC
jgi:hypothetical protein